jgi:NAD(P)-dependent dehydrogenase (short-subunit alcohol dehydrogenase family)
MYVTQAVLPAMKRRRSGVIVNVSAVGGVNGSAFSEVFCATKFAVEGFTEAIAQVKIGILPGPKRITARSVAAHLWACNLQAAMHFNIRVCVVEPGPTYWEGMPALKVAGSSGAADPETQELWRRCVGRAGYQHISIII